MKKKIVSLLYVLILFSTFSIGFATWVLSNDFFFEPEYEYQQEFDLYNQNKEFNGLSQDVTIPDELITIFSTDYNAPVYKQNGNIMNEHIEAGKYDVYFEAKNKEKNNDVTINFTIHKLSIDLIYNLIEVDSQTRIEDLGKECVHEAPLGTKFIPDIGVKSQSIANYPVNLIYDKTPLVVPLKKKTIEVKLDSESSKNYSLNNPNFIITLEKIKQKIKVSLPTNNVLEVPYDASYISFGKFNDTYVLNNIKFEDLNGNPLNDLTAKILYMHNGYYLYGKPDEPLTFNSKAAPTGRLIGSTYMAKIVLYDSKIRDDYNIVNDKIILKYQTVNIGGTKYTVEDALAASNSSTIALEGINPTTEARYDYVTTCFTKVQFGENGLINESIDSEYIIKGGTSLKVPFDDTAYNTTEQHSAGVTGVYSTLIVPEGVTINVSPNANIVVCGAVADSGTVGQRGVLMNNGTINLNQSGIYAYGYVKGNGFVNTLNGSIAQDVFMMYNYPGGRNSAGMNGKVFPLSIYSFHNISCNLKVDKQSCFGAFYRQSASGVTAEGKAAVLGPDLINNSKNSGLFNMKNNNEYIIKSVENVTVGSDNVAKIDNNFNNSITSSNQSKSQREILDIYGSFSDNSMSVSVGGQNISTSKDVAMPIGYMRINIHANNSVSSVGNLHNNSYQFFPGSELIIDEGCTMNIANGVNVVAYDENYRDNFTYINEGKLQPTDNCVFSYKKYHPDWFNQKDKTKIGSQIIVNGTLNVDGGFGGKISTNSKNATVKLNNYGSGSINVLDNIVYKKAFVFGSHVQTRTERVETKVKLYDGINIMKNYNSVGIGTLLSKQVGNNYGWFVNGSAKLSYETFTDEVISQQDINISSEGYSIIQSNLPIPTRQYYMFDGWYRSDEYLDEEKVIVGSKMFAGSTLYAKWNPIDYIIDYVHFDDKGNVLPDNQFNNSNIININALSNFPLTIPSNINGLVFGGWYEDQLLTKKINTLTGALLNNLDSSNNVKVYAKWYPIGTPSYSVKYISNNNELDSYITEERVVNQNIEDYALQKLDSNDNNIYMSKYFKGWKVQGTNTIITKITSDLLSNNSVILEAVWGNKTVINVDLTMYPDLNIKIYAKPGLSFTLPNDMETLKDLLDPNKKFDGWWITGGLLDQTRAEPGKAYIFSNTDGEVINVMDVYMQTVYVTDALNKYVKVFDENNNEYFYPESSGNFEVHYGSYIKFQIYDKAKGIITQSNMTLIVKDANNNILIQENNKSVYGGKWRDLPQKVQVFGDIHVETKQR